MLAHVSPSEVFLRNEYDVHLLCSARLLYSNIAYGNETPCDQRGEGEAFERVPAMDAVLGVVRFVHAYTRFRQSIPPYTRRMGQVEGYLRFISPTPLGEEFPLP